jgi:hypothetical protein
LIEELADSATQQIIVVSAAPETEGPHTLASPRLDGRARAGDYLRSAETAQLRDVAAIAGAAGLQLFVIRPPHNPVGPFDFAGAFDPRSDRRQPLTELIARGYEDSYRQFIEPVVGASGERVGLV